MTGYIYMITNNINNKQYIGLTSRDYNLRWEQHIAEANKTNPKSYISRAIKKYGLDNFTFEVIETVKRKNPNELRNKLKIKEIKYIEEYGTFLNGYNRTQGGDRIKESTKQRCTECMREICYINKKFTGMTDCEYEEWLRGF